MHMILDALQLRVLTQGIQLRYVTATEQASRSQGEFETWVRTIPQVIRKLKTHYTIESGMMNCGFRVVAYNPDLAELNYYLLKEIKAVAIIHRKMIANTIPSAYKPYRASVIDDQRLLDTWIHLSLDCQLQQEDIYHVKLLWGDIFWQDMVARYHLSSIYYPPHSRT